MIYFFKNKKGIFAIDSAEHAWNQYKDRNNDKFNNINYIGQSSGETFKAIKKKRNDELASIKAEIRGKEEMLIRYETGLEKLYGEKFLTDKDPDVIKAKKAIKIVKEEFTALVQVRNKQAQGIQEEAMSAEIKEAEKNPLPPLNKDVIEGSVVDNRALLANIQR